MASVLDTDITVPLMEVVVPAAKELDEIAPYKTTISMRNVRIFGMDLGIYLFLT